VEVLGLRAGSKQDAALLKAGEDAKQKSYRAVCRLSRAPTPEQLAALNAMTVRGGRDVASAGGPGSNSCTQSVTSCH
jgi:hypothetical protein